MESRSVLYNDFLKANNGDLKLQRLMMKFKFICSDGSYDIYLCPLVIRNCEYFNKFLFGLGDLPFDDICECIEFSKEEIMDSIRCIYLCNNGSDNNMLYPKSHRTALLLDMWCVKTNDRYINILNIAIKHELDSFINYLNDSNLSYGFKTLIYANKNICNSICDILQIYQYKDCATLAEKLNHLYIIHMEGKHISLFHQFIESLFTQDKLKQLALFMLFKVYSSAELKKNSISYYFLKYIDPYFESLISSRSSNSVKTPQEPTFYPIDDLDVDNLDEL